MAWLLRQGSTSPIAIGRRDSVAPQGFVSASRLEEVICPAPSDGIARALAPGHHPRPECTTLVTQVQVVLCKLSCDAPDDSSAGDCCAQRSPGGASHRRLQTVSVVHPMHGSSE